MSGPGLSGALEELEQLLQQELPDPESVAAWRERFEAARAEAVHGPDWSLLQARARDLSARLDARIRVLSEERDRLRKEMGLQGRGARALKGYKPS